MLALLWISPARVAVTVALLIVRVPFGMATVLPPLALAVLRVVLASRMMSPPLLRLSAPSVDSGEASTRNVPTFMEEAIAAGIKLVVTPAEGVPVHDAIAIGRARDASPEMLVLAGIAWFQAGREAQPTRIAVLPFENLSGDPEQAYFSDGLAAEIRGTLSRNRLLQVVGQASSNVFRERKQDAKEISRQLDATFLLDGSVRRSGDTVRIVTELIDGFAQDAPDLVAAASPSSRPQVPAGPMASGSFEEFAFFSVFQPIVELASGTLSGFEALLRWRHPGLEIGRAHV